MKNALFLFLLMLQLPVIAQENTIIDNIKYQNAYNYIIKDSIMNSKDVYVSSLLVDLNRGFFSESLRSHPYLKLTVDSLIQFSGFGYYESEELKKLFRDLSSTSKNILFFSPIEKNTLMAELFIDKFPSNKFIYGEVNGKVINAYLFFFNEDGDLKNVFKQEIIYEILSVEDKPIPQLVIPKSAIEGKLP